ncbi:MAG: flagellar motor switch phosphatase FliY [Firmicutes bacterium]|nr:flagellar motor switch phosphatase FliY [Bacillota bacterium]
MARLTPLQLDALGESGNIAMGAAATALSQLLGQQVEITTPHVTYRTMKDIRDAHPIPCVLVRVHYTRGLQGSNIFVLSERDAGIIANMMMGNPDQPVPDPLDELYLSAVSEAMNQMMGSSATAMSEMFGRTIDITPPELQFITNLQQADREQVQIADEQTVIQIAFKLTVGNYINSTMLQIVPEEFAVTLVEEMLGPLGGMPAAETDTVHLTEAEREALLLFGRNSLQAAAVALASMLAQDVSIAVETVEEISPDSLKEEIAEPRLAVAAAYQGDLAGKSLFLMGRHEAAAIAAHLLGAGEEAVEDFDEMRQSALAEAFSQMLGAAMTNIAATYGINAYVDTPEINLAGELPPEFSDGREPLVRLVCRLQRAQQAESGFLQILPWQTAQAVVKSVSLPKETAAAELFAAEKQPVLPPAESREPLFFGDDVTGDCKLPLDLIKDVTVQITGVLGRRKISLKELRYLAFGDVVELDAAAADPVEVLANGRLVARGQIVVYKDQLGIRLTEIVTSKQAH